MGLARVFRCVHVLILRRLQVRIMVLKSFNQVLNTERPRSHASPAGAPSWWRSDQRRSDHDRYVLSVCVLVAVQGRLHCPLLSGQVNLKSCYVSDEPALSRSPPPLPSTTVVLCTPGCGVTVHSTLPLACHPPWPSMGVQWVYLCD